MCVCRLAKLVVTPFPSHSQVRTGQVYLRDCAPVSAYALMLFGGDLAGGASQQPPPPSRGVGGRAGGAVVGIIPGGGADAVLTVDGWIKFRVPRRVQALIVETRAQLTSLLQQKIASPEIELSSAGRGILAAVTALLDTPPPER